VVFLHGLGGDAFTTWRYGDDDSSSWPHWLGNEFPDVGVWSLGYAASPTKLTRILGWFSWRHRDSGYAMTLPDRALQVLDLMVQLGIGQRPLLFIGHSLGGLLAKQILRISSDAVDVPSKHAVFANTRAVLFLATPHSGANLASLIDSFRAVFGATVTIQDLRAHDAHLRNLRDWYRNHSEPAGIQTATYYELRGVKGVLPIVNPDSAHSGVGADPVGLDEDHISIAKPCEHDAQVCGAAANLLRTRVLVPSPATPAKPNSAHVESVQLPKVIVQIDSNLLLSRDSVRLPCELPSPAEKHFGRHTELRQLTERLRAGKNSAVVGSAGLGKTALAAEAVRAVVGDRAETLAGSPFPDGIVFIDLYTFRGRAEPAWNRLANALAGPEFMNTSPARDRATDACRARRILVILEGGEEADGQEGRASIPDLCSALSPQNRLLLLTRLSTQAVPAESVELKEALHPDDAAALLDSLTQGRITGEVRERVLALAEGHPLALTWAGNLLARDDEEPGRLADDWQAGGLPKLSDPRQAEHTLEWLFNRSVRGLDETARQLLAAAGLLAHAPFPLAAMEATVDNLHPSIEVARDALKSLIQRGLMRRSGEVDHWQFSHVLGYRFARKETGSDAAMRESLGRWLSGHLRAAVDGRFGNERAPSLTRALEHGAALLRTDDDQRLWIPLARELLYDASERLEALGRLDLVKLALNAVEDWLARVPALNAHRPDWLRERSVLLTRQGDVLRSQGDLAGALAAYRESLSVRQRLAEADPSNAGWQRDISWSLTRMAQLHEQEGNRTEALRFAEESLVIDERLAALDRSNVTWQRDVAVSRALVIHLRG
jgi:tetratricopeptide (TPR) repeat protein